MFLRFFLTVLILIPTLLSCGGGMKNPYYLEDHHPYRKRVYLPFQDAYLNVIEVLQQDGWRIAKEVGADTFEYHQKGLESAKSTLILTETKKQTLPWPGEAQMNIYIHSTDNMTDIEVRYRSARSAMVRHVPSYRNDTYVEDFLYRIENYHTIQK